MGPLHSILDRFTLAQMRFGRTVKLYLLIAAIAWSSLAGAADPCAGSGVASGAGHSVSQDSSGHAPHHGDATQQQADDTECPCCDDCAVACVFSACNPAATAFSVAHSIYDRPSRFDLVVTSAHDGPVLYPPFRPPILQA